MQQLQDVGQGNIANLMNMRGSLIGGEGQGGRGSVQRTSVIQDAALREALGLHHDGAGSSSHNLGAARGGGAHAPTTHAAMLHMQNIRAMAHDEETGGMPASAAQFRQVARRISLVHSALAGLPAAPDGWKSFATIAEDGSRGLPHGGQLMRSHQTPGAAFAAVSGQLSSAAGLSHIAHPGLRARLKKVAGHGGQQKGLAGQSTNADETKKLTVNTFEWALPGSPGASPSARGSQSKQRSISQPPEGAFPAHGGDAHLLHLQEHHAQQYYAEHHQVRHLRGKKHVARDRQEWAHGQTQRGSDRRASPPTQRGSDRWASPPTGASPRESRLFPPPELRQKLSTIDTSKWTAFLPKS